MHRAGLADKSRPEFLKNGCNAGQYLPEAMRVFGIVEGVALIRKSRKLYASETLGVELSESRLFHQKKYVAHKPRSRQNDTTLCPLRACPESSPRAFAQAFSRRSRYAITQLCCPMQPSRKMRFA
jgi:hypothetical protein